LEAEPTSGLGPALAEAASGLGFSRAEASVVKSEASVGKSEASVKKSEAIPPRFPRLTFTLDPKAPPKGITPSPDLEGARKSVRKDRESRGTTPVMRSRVVLPRKGSPTSRDLGHEDRGPGVPRLPGRGSRDFWASTETVLRS